jgi:hypothetical protein
MITWPSAINGAHLATSPICGELATAFEWQFAHTALYVSSPDAKAVALAKTKQESKEYLKTRMGIPCKYAIAVNEN